MIKTKYIIGFVVSIFALAVNAATYEINFDYQPGSGQIVKRSPALVAGDVVNCKFHTPVNLNVDKATSGNFFVTQPLGDAGMSGVFEPFGAKRFGLLSFSYQFRTYKLEADKDYKVSVVVDGQTGGIACKLNPGRR